MFFTPRNRNEEITAAVRVIQEDGYDLMEIEGNAPAAVVEPTTTMEELLVTTNPCLERLLLTMNAAPISAFAEAGCESEGILLVDLTVIGAKPSSQRKKKLRENCRDSDSSDSKHSVSQSDSSDLRLSEDSNSPGDS